jgi:hypothetical protein
MSDITRKARLQAQRGHVIHTRPWTDIVERYRSLASFAPMVRLVEAVAASQASTQLFAATSMFDLLISDGPDFRFGDSTLVVSYHPTEGVFQFRHHSFSSHDDAKSCSKSEALETFRLFVRMKFGVLDARASD